MYIYCIVSINFNSASRSAHQSEALPVRKTQRKERGLQTTKRDIYICSMYVKQMTFSIFSHSYPTIKSICQSFKLPIHSFIHSSIHPSINPSIHPPFPPI